MRTLVVVTVVVAMSLAGPGAWANHPPPETNPCNVGSHRPDSEATHRPVDTPVGATNGMLWVHDDGYVAFSGSGGNYISVDASNRDSNGVPQPRAEYTNARGRYQFRAGHEGPLICVAAEGDKVTVP